MSRTLIAFALLLLVAAPSAAAQTRPSHTQLRTEIRTLLIDLRDAASRRNWSAMETSFPAGGSIAERVHGVVTGGPGGGGLSFWAPTAKPNFDELVVMPVRPDLVALSLPFTDGASPGSYGAVFERRESGWQITCFQESFPSTNIAPGCVADLPSPQ